MDSYKKSATLPVDESYLSPYLQASQRHGAGFESLLWASPGTQRARFEAICSTIDLNGKSILDAGCGRADFMSFLLERNVHPADYIGLEAVDALADAAETPRYSNGRIIRGDFVRDPARLFVGADIIVFSGSLNTLQSSDFYRVLSRAWDAAAEAVVFNFLCSPALAGKDYLVWHRAEHVQHFARGLGKDVRAISDYLPGDCTIAIIKIE